ncbi:unnamed protein product [Ixodes pacificus]
MPVGMSPRLDLSVAAVVWEMWLLSLFTCGPQISTQGLTNVTNLSVAELAEQLTNVSTPGVSQRVITDVKEGGHRLVEIFQDSNGTVLDCNALGDKNTIDTALSVIPQDMVTYVDQDEMQYFLDLCDNRTENVTLGPLKSIFEFITTALQSLVIFPGTKWCGAGNIAQNYDDLGRERETDLCCRDHDHTYNSIGAYETEHGITNFQFFTMTNCLDDCKFYDCLLNVSSLASDTVGTIYFNTLGSNCFAYGYPQECVKYNVIFIPLLTRLCTEYQLDTSKSQEWRTYPPPNFSDTAETRICMEFYNQTG